MYTKVTGFYFATERIEKLLTCLKYDTQAHWACCTFCAALQVGAGKVSLGAQAGQPKAQ